MNIFLKSILVSLVLSSICFVILYQQKKEKLYTATILLEPDESKLGRINLNEWEKADLIQHIFNRTRGFERHISFNKTNKLQINLYNLTDTQQLTNIITSSNIFEVWEMYLLNDVIGGFEKADKFLQNQNTNRKVDSSNSPNLLSTVERTGLYSKLEFEKPVSYDQASLGRIKTKDTSEIFTIFKRPEINSNFPADIVFVLGKSISKNDSTYSLYGLKTYNQPDRPFLTNSDLDEIYPDFDKATLQPTLQVKLKKNAAHILEKLTERNVGKPLAMTLDKQVIWAPRVEQKISGGSLQIRAGFTAKETFMISGQLTSGKLPIPLSVNSISIKKNSSFSKKTILFLGACLIFSFGLAFLLFYMLKSSINKPFQTNTLPQNLP